MIVDARDVLLTVAEARIRFATAEYLDDDLAGVDDPELRLFYLRNRLTRVCGLLSEAVDLIRLANTKAAA